MAIIYSKHAVDLKELLESITKENKAVFYNTNLKSAQESLNSIN